MRKGDGVAVVFLVVWVLSALLSLALTAAVIWALVALIQYLGSH